MKELGKKMREIIETEKITSPLNLNVFSSPSILLLKQHSNIYKVFMEIMGFF